MSSDASRTPRTSYRLLRLPAVIVESGNGRSTIYRRVSDGLWPRPVKLGPRAVAWPEAEVIAMNAARVAAKSDDEIRALVARLEGARAGFTCAM